MPRSKKYWTRRLHTAGSRAVIKEIQDAVSQQDNITATNGLLAIVEAMGISDERELESKTLRLCEHLILLEYSGIVDTTKHWRHEVEVYRMDLLLLIRKEPHLKSKLREVVQTVMPLAKRLAFEHVFFEKFSSAKEIPDLPFELVFPPKDFPLRSKA